MNTLIVGTGRSGTKWITETLHTQGVSAEHQTIRHAHVLGEPFDWPDVEVIVSFEAVPILPRLSARKLLVVRHPDDMIGSWLRLGAFTDRMRSEFALWATVLDRWFPNILREPTPPERAARYWLEWNLYALMHTDDHTRLDRIADTGWFPDIVWTPPPTSSHYQVELRPALRRTVDRMWGVL